MSRNSRTQRNKHESAAQHGSAQPANPGTDTSVGENRHICRSNLSIILKLRALFPAKTAIEIALRTDACQRTAERWLAGECEMPSSALVDLIQSDVGPDLVTSLAERSEARAWRDFRRQVGLMQLRRDHAAQARRIAKLEAGDHDDTDRDQPLSLSGRP